MKDKHIQALLTSCLAIAECSGCSRRKFGALLVDPHTNSIISEGYNGPPRGASGELCGPMGAFCARSGLRDQDIVVTPPRAVGSGTFTRGTLTVCGRDWALPREIAFPEQGKTRLLSTYPEVPSGTRIEIGCHHAEANALMKAARRGVSTDGAWLVVTGEPCLLCAKLLHHAGVVKVICIRGGFLGSSRAPADAGPAYLRQYGVEVEYRDGPRDPRSCGEDA